MKNQSEAVIKSVQCLIGFYKELGDFIKAFDKLMYDSNYEAVTQSKDEVVVDTSKTLDRSHRWLPVCFYRDYTTGSKEYFSLTIVLDKMNKENEEVQAPLLLLTKVSFQRGMKEKTWAKNYWGDVSWDMYFYAKPFKKTLSKIYLKKDLLTPEHRKALTGERGWSNEDFSLIKDLKFLCLPLMELNSEKIIKEQVFHPMGI